MSINNYPTEAPSVNNEDDWSKPDAEGIIHVPDELDPLINKVAFQIRLWYISEVQTEPQAVCNIVYKAQQFFAEMFKKELKEKDKEIQLLKQEQQKNKVVVVGAGSDTAMLRTVFHEAMEKNAEFLIVPADRIEDALPEIKINFDIKAPPAIPDAEIAPFIPEQPNYINGKKLPRKKKR